MVLNYYKTITGGQIRKKELIMTNNIGKLPDPESTTADLHDEVYRRIQIAMQVARENQTSHEVPMLKDTTSLIMEAVASELKRIGEEVIEDTTAMRDSDGIMWIDYEDAKQRLTKAIEQMRGKDLDDSNTSELHSS